MYTCTAAVAKISILLEMLYNIMIVYVRDRVSQNKPTSVGGGGGGGGRAPTRGGGGGHPPTVLLKM